MIVPGALAAFVLYLVRTSMLVLFSPLLGYGTGFAGYKIALIFAVALILYLATGTPLAWPLAVPEYGAMALREVLMGLALAMVLQVVALTLKVAGELIGNEMAFNMAQQTDPVTGGNTPLITRVYETLFLLGLLMVDAHHLLLRALGDSFGRAPVGRVVFSTDAVVLLQDLLREMFAAGISFAGPVLVLLVLVSVLIGLLSRAVPHLNILEVGFTLRIGMGLVAIFLFAPLIAPALHGLYGRFAVVLDELVGVLGG